MCAFSFRLQLLTCVLLAASLADVIATAVEGRRKDVAQFQYLTPSLMAVTMVGDLGKIMKSKPRPCFETAPSSTSHNLQNHVQCWGQSTPS